MDIKIEHDGQSWCFSVAMTVDAIVLELRAYYNTPLPEREKPFSFDGPRVTVAPKITKQWRSDGDRNIQRCEVPWPDGLEKLVRAALATQTFVERS